MKHSIHDYLFNPQEGTTLESLAQAGGERTHEARGVCGCLRMCNGNKLEINW